MRLSEAGLIACREYLALYYNLRVFLRSMAASDEERAR